MQKPGSLFKVVALASSGVLVAVLMTGRGGGLPLFLVGNPPGTESLPKQPNQKLGPEDRPEDQQQPRSKALAQDLKAVAKIIVWRARKAIEQGRSNDARVLASLAATLEVEFEPLDDRSEFVLTDLDKLDRIGRSMPLNETVKGLANANQARTGPGVDYRIEMPGRSKASGMAGWQKPPTHSDDALFSGTRAISFVGPPQLVEDAGRIDQIFSTDIFHSDSLQTCLSQQKARSDPPTSRLMMGNIEIIR